MYACCLCPAVRTCVSGAFLGFLSTFVASTYITGSPDDCLSYSCLPPPPVHHLVSYWSPKRLGIVQGTLQGAGQLADAHTSKDATPYCEYLSGVLIVGSCLLTQGVGFLCSHYCFVLEHSQSWRRVCTDAYMADYQ
jgi:hypothetical protein